MLQSRNLDFTSATLNLTGFMVLPDDERHDPGTLTFPLRTIAFGDVAHISIRNAEGNFAEYLTAGGQNDIVTDYWIPGQFVETGIYTFVAEARLKDGTCIFSYTLTQRLEGKPGV